MHGVRKEVRLWLVLVRVLPMWGRVLSVRMVSRPGRPDLDCWLRTSAVWSPWAR